MFTALIVAICLALSIPLHRLMQRTFPRRFGTLRPNLAWLTAGLVSLLGFALSGLLLETTPSLFAIRVSALLFGIGSIAYFAHRRVYFRRGGVFEYRFGIPTRACRYANVAHCEAGKDIIREGLLLRLKSGAAWGAPGLMPADQIAEALWQVQRAGLEIPNEDELRLRLGLDYGHIQAVQPMRP